jgi:NAD-dependent deacetylase
VSADTPVAGAPWATARRVAATSEAVRFADLIARSERAVALTGAGVSVPSGIPDFRSAGTGLWRKVNPMEVAHIDAFHRDPDRFWRFYGERFVSLRDKRPNPAHLALAELERRGLLRGVITQNVDRLHRAAGSVRVIEVHGSIDRSVCLECGRTVDLETVLDLLGQDRGAPQCDHCRRPLKPDVVLFGELLPEAAMADAQSLVSEADLLLCIGSSLEVYPVAALPEATLARGGSLAIVTQGATAYDDRVTVRLTGDVAEELEGVMAALDDR